MCVDENFYRIMTYPSVRDFPMCSFVRFSFLQSARIRDFSIVSCEWLSIDGPFNQYNLIIIVSGYRPIVFSIIKSNKILEKTKWWLREKNWLSAIFFCFQVKWFFFVLVSNSYFPVFKVCWSNVQPRST